MVRWEATTQDKYGIVIYNFMGTTVHQLPLSVGDAVHILEKNGDWYCGFCLKNRSRKGIFPKSYIHLKEASVEYFGQVSNETVTQKETPVIQEMTTVLREWGTIWKSLYERNNVELMDSLHKMLLEMFEWRQLIMSGSLTLDELKEYKQTVTSKIDYGNRLLGLDLVVREEADGTITDPLTNSVVTVFRQHEKANQQITQRMKEEQHVTQPEWSGFQVRKGVIPSYNLFVTVKNFVCYVGEESELLMCLYDATESKFISENYLCRWGSRGMPKDIEMLNNLRAIFTDLGSRDINRSKVFLICQIIRRGRMEVKETDNIKKYTADLRRPFGVAALDITLIVTGKIQSDEDKQHFVPFDKCNGEESLEGLIRRATSSKEINHRGQGLWVTMKMMVGEISQVRQEFPHLVDSRTAVTRKMGFPEVIMPGDVRNDVYITLVQGEFEKGPSKKSSKNTEVSVKVYTADGKVVENVVGFGSGESMQNEFRSTIYYQVKSPRWSETVKVAIPIEDFYQSHLKFTFRHRSTVEYKDKNEKDFAIAYLKLMQADGTTVVNDIHDLCVYKCDGKSSEAELTKLYLRLPSSRAEMEAKNNASNPAAYGKSALRNRPLTLSKDSFQICVLVCSTKLTQNVDLLGLLKWRSDLDNLPNILRSLMNVTGGEVVKFLQDTLDALFGIMMETPESNLYNNLVFDALIFVISLISDRKYQHFRPVLDTYLREHFSATLAYNKLMDVLNKYVENADMPSAHEQLLKALKSLEYIFKFIIRSRVLYSNLYKDGKDKFEQKLRSLLKAISDMMSIKKDSTLYLQGAALKYVPSIITDLVAVFNAQELAAMLKTFLQSLAPEKLVKQKLACMDDFIRSTIFKIPECRGILIPLITSELQELLEQKKYFEECAKVLGDLLEALYREDMGPVQADISVVMQTLLRSVIQTVIQMDRESPLIGAYVACMINILREMNEAHFQEYIQHFPSPLDLHDFLMEIFMVFRDLVNTNVYPPDWFVMITLQNNVILGAMKHFAEVLVTSFLQEEKFEQQLWNNLFHLAVAFLTQDQLQLENFSDAKRTYIRKKYADMRRDVGFEIIRHLWFKLGKQKIKFIPGMVGPFLEVTLVPEVQLRRAIIPVFFDMMKIEFDIIKADLVRHSFKEVETEIISQLDVLVEGGRGDKEYKELFSKIISELCKKHPEMMDMGMTFVHTVSKLLERLLDYRTIISDENKENRMSCTVNLLHFYEEINRQEMYIRYLYKLHDLHLECDNYSEAAFTLKLHSDLLKWTDDRLSRHSDKHPGAETHRQLKELLYYDSINLFDKGKLWEAGISMCEELAAQYKTETYDYTKLSQLLQMQARFYDNIMKELRPEPEYFRVGYYGSGFPPFLANKEFIYRGKEFERLSDFTVRLQNQFPTATLLYKTTAPEMDILDSDGQYLQIFTVQPINNISKKFRGRVVSDQIRNYYKVNEIQKYTYSRPFHKGQKDKENEFATMWIEKTNFVIKYFLPGILRWFEVSSAHTEELSPLQNAVVTMEQTNKRLRSMVEQYQAEPGRALNPLSLQLNGVIDAAVQGGPPKYEQAFCTEEYLANHPDDELLVEQLKDCFSYQIPLLEDGLQIHREKCTDNLKPFQEKMEKIFAERKTEVEKKYGKRIFDETLSREVTVFANNYSDLRLQSMFVNFNRATTSSSSSDRNTLVATSSSEAPPPPPPVPDKSSGKSATLTVPSPKIRRNSNPIVLEEKIQSQRPQRPQPSTNNHRNSKGNFPSNHFSFSSPAILPPLLPDKAPDKPQRPANHLSSSQEELLTAPPLPPKHQPDMYADYSNLPDEPAPQMAPITPKTPKTPSAINSSYFKDKPLLPTPTSDDPGAAARLHRKPTGRYGSRKNEKD